MSDGDELPELPSEIIEEILVRCSVKTLIRFLCVSKHWKSIVCSTNFISRHMNYATMQNKKYSRLLLLHDIYSSIRSGKDLYRVRQDNLEIDSQTMEFPLDKGTGTELPKPYEDRYFLKRTCLVGVSKGLVCLYEYSLAYLSANFILWNPAIRKYVIIPFSSPRGQVNSAGFFFDELANDYKVVKIEQSPPVNVEVYEMKKNAWRVIDSASARYPTRLMDRKADSGVAVNGAIYWLGVNRDDHSDVNVISFNVSMEVFEEMNVPISLVGRKYYQFTLGSLGGLLCIHHKMPFSNNCEVWVMKEYGVSESWTKLYILPGMTSQVLGLMTNDEKRLLMYKSQRDLVDYDPKTEATSFIVQLGRFDFSFTCDYVETLSLLKDLPLHDLSF